MSLQKPLNKLEIVLIVEKFRCYVINYYHLYLSVSTHQNLFQLLFAARHQIFASGISRKTGGFLLKVCDVKFSIFCFVVKFIGVPE